MDNHRFIAKGKVVEKYTTNNLKTEIYCVAESPHHARIIVLALNNLWENEAAVITLSAIIQDMRRDRLG